MRAIEVSDDAYRRIEEFSAVARAVMGEEVSAETCLAMALDRGLQAMLADILQGQDHSTLIESIQQLAARHPEAVYRYVSDIIALGAGTRTSADTKARIGFSAPEPDLPS